MTLLRVEKNEDLSVEGFNLKRNSVGMVMLSSIVCHLNVHLASFSDELLLHSNLSFQRYIELC